MLDQLARGAPAEVRSQTLQLAVDGSMVQKFKPLQMVDNIGIERVAEGFGCVLQHGQSPDIQDIEDEITEMLSVFEPSNALPAESKDPSACPSERSRKYRAFRDLFAEYATSNLGIFIRLQSLIDAEFQTQVFFEKIEDRITRAFKGLDEYMKKGPTADTTTEVYDIPTCAEKLKTLAQVIGDYYHQQTERNGGAKDIAVRASAALIKMLDGVIDRDFDAYAYNTWGGIPPADPRMNNLFINLIRSPDEDDGHFVVDVLEELPYEDVLRNHWEALGDTDERLAQKWPPQEYMDAFRAITQDKRGAGSEE